MTRRVLAALVAAVLMASTLAGVATATADGSIEADPTEAEVTATHTVTVTVGEASESTWTGIAVNYTGGADVRDVGRMDLARVGVDRGDDASNATVDEETGTSVSGVSASDDGTTLIVELDGSVGVSAGDELVLVYRNVTNPRAGEWDVGIDVNPRSSGGETTTTLAVGGSMSDDSMDGNESMDDSMDGTSSPTPSPTVTEMATDTGMATESATPGGTDGAGPGFGVAAAAGAVVAAALLARRR